MADVTVLQDARSAFSRTSHRGIHHRSGHVVGTNDLVGEQRPEYGIDRAQEAIAQIGLSARLDGIDICGAKDVQVGKSCRGQYLLSSPLYRAKAIRLRPVGSAPLPLKNANVALGLLARSTRANSTV